MPTPAMCGARLSEPRSDHSRSSPIARLLSQHPILAFVVVACGIAFIGYQLFTAWLRTLVDDFHIGPLRLNGAHDIQWYGKREDEADDEPHTHVRVGCAGPGGGSAAKRTRCGRSGAWFGLLISGVRITVPRAHLTRRLETANKPPREPEPPSWLVVRIRSLIARAFAVGGVAGKAALMQLRRFAAIAALDYLLYPVELVVVAFVAHLAVRLSDVVIQLEDVGSIRLTVRAGIDARGGRLGGYVLVESLEVFAGSDDDPAVRVLGALLTASAALQDGSLRSLVKRGIGERLQIRDASVDVALVFADAEPVVVRIDQVMRIKTDFESVSRQARRIAKERKPPKVDINEPKQRRPPPVKAKSSTWMAPTRRRENLGAALRSIDFRLPQLSIAHRMPVKTDAQGLSVAALGRDLTVRIDFGPYRSREPHPHRRWHGKSDETVVRAEVRWTSWQLGAETGLRSSASIRWAFFSDPVVDLSTSQLVDIGELKVVATSTWLPRKLDIFMRPSETFSQRRHRLADIDHARVIVDVDLASVHAEVTTDHLVELQAVAQALPRPSETSRSKRRRREFLGDLPNVVAGIAVGATSIKLVGPKPAHGPVPGVGEGSDSSPEPPASSPLPDHLLVTLPYVRARLETDFVELAAFRTTTQRHDLRRSVRRGELKVPPSLNGNEPGEADEAFSERSGVFAQPTRGFNPVLRFDEDPEEHTLVCRFRAGVSFGQLNAVVQSAGGVGRSDHASRVGHRLARIGPSELSTTGHLHGYYRHERPEVELDSRIAHVQLVIERADVELWHPQVVAMVQSAVKAVRPETHLRPDHAVKERFTLDHRPSLVSQLPQDVFIHAAIGAIHLRVAGPDPQTDSTLRRGIDLTIASIAGQYLMQTDQIRHHEIDLVKRAKLDLIEDVRAQSNADAAARGRVLGHVKLDLGRVAMQPILDAHGAHDKVGGADEKTATPHPTTRARAVSTLLPYMQNGDGETRPPQATEWEFTGREQANRRYRETKATNQGLHPYTLLVKSLAVRATISEKLPRPDMDPAWGLSDEDIELTVASGTPVAKLSALHIYCALLTWSALRSLAPQHGAYPPRPTDEYGPPPRTVVVRARVRFTNLDVFVVLPQNVRLYVRLHSFDAGFDSRTGLDLAFNSLLIAVVSATVNGAWDDLFRITGGRIAVGHAEGAQAEWSPIRVAIEAETMRIRVPYKYAPSDVIDNAATLVKATKQMVHQFVKGGFDSVIQPVAEAAKHLPELSVRTKAFVITADDDAFEVALNSVWRAGRDEQASRLAALAVFEERTTQKRQEREHNPDAPVGRSPEEVLGKLQKHFERAWTNRIRKQHAELRSREAALASKIEGRLAILRPDDDLPIVLTRPTGHVPLARGVFRRLDLHITRPSFTNVRDWLHDVGDGMPKDTDFSLIVPLHLALRFTDGQITLRDYPLPLLSVPAHSDGRAHNWDLDTDLVVAEELVPGDESVRFVPCDVFPAFDGMPAADRYTITVPRTAMPTKLYARPTIDIHTDLSTRVGWGNSVQPAVQDLARVFDSFTKIPPDPSERLGFWDKARLQMHGRLLFRFLGAALLAHGLD